MSRHPITVRSIDNADDNAVIGFDPPLGTYFLLGFEDPDTEFPGLWLGTRLREFPDLASLTSAADAKGYMLDGLTEPIVAEMAWEAMQPHRPSLVERCGWPLR